MGPRIYPSFQDTNINAKGSLIITYDEIVNGPGGDNFEIYVNDVLRDKIWLDVDGFYSTHLVLNDVVKLLFPGTQQSLSIDISRKNYTTDDNNDNGLTYTYIDTINQFNTTDFQYSFTATTTNNSYNFEYLIGTSTLQVTPTPLPPGFCKGFNGDVMDIAVQPDGKIIVTGTFTSFTDKNLTTTVCPYITRLTSGGTIDLSFTPSAAVQTFVADGKYYICLLNNGYFLLYQRFNQFNFKVSPDGLLHEYLGLGDTSITPPAVYLSRIPSNNGTGKWYIVGKGFTVGGIVSPLYRYNSDGSRDTTFNPPSETRQATAMYELSNGKVIVAVASNYTYQLNSDGTFDFVYNVYQPLYGYIGHIAEGQSVDKVYFSLYSGLIIRMNTTDGSMDYGFLFGNYGYVSFVQNLGAGVDDDKIIYNNSSIALRRLDITGTTDSSFTNNLGSSSGTTVNVRRVSPTSDSMYIFGAFQQWNGYSVGGLFKLNPDGSEDFSFYNFLCIPTHTPTPTPTPTATPTPTPTPAPTNTPSPTSTPTLTPTPTPTVTPTPTPNPIEGQYMLAVKSDNLIYRTSNYGSTWTQVTGFTTGMTITDTAISETGQYQIISRYNGTLYVSSNYGVSFTSVGSSDTYIACSISRTGQYINAITDTGATRKLVWSTNYGVSFPNSFSLIGQTSSDCSIDDFGNSYISFRNGISKYILSGSSMTTLYSAATLNWSSVTASADGTKVAATRTGSTVSYSTNGTSFTLVNPGLSNLVNINGSRNGTFLKIYSSDQNNRRSSNFGVSWSSELSFGYPALSSTGIYQALAFGNDIRVSSDYGSSYNIVYTLSGANWKNLSMNR